MDRTVRGVLIAVAAWGASVGLGGVPGCAPASREQLVKETLKADPGFSSALEKHRELINRIETYERELALKRTTVEQTIAQLRKDLAASADLVRSRTLEVRKRMRPDQERLEHALSMGGEELRAKQSQRASLGRSVSHLKKALKSAGTAWSAQERAHQQAQISEMLRDAERLDREIATLRAHVRLIKIKLLLIKL